MVGHSILEFLWVRIRDGILWQHVEISIIVHVERAVTKDLDKIINIVSQLRTAQHHHTPILSIRKIVLR